MTIVYLSLGSNSGNRFRLIEQAINFVGMCENVKLLQTSALYETEPWGVKDQNWFLNIIAKIQTTLSAQDLLLKLQNVEKTLGRNRDNERRWGERPIDIDIIFYGNECINTEILSVPHPRMQERAFVLVPFLEIEPDFVHPVLKKTISELYDDLEDVEEVFLYGTRIENI